MEPHKIIRFLNKSVQHHQKEIEDLRGHFQWPSRKVLDLPQIYLRLCKFKVAPKVVQLSRKTPVPRQWRIDEDPYYIPFS